MSAILVDSNVLIDIASESKVWSLSSREAVRQLGRDHELVINSIIFSEVSITFQRIEEVDDLLARDVFRREEIPWEAAFLAGKVFLSYRRNRGIRLSPLPDFFIGAHAATMEYAVLTRDPKPYRTYFPTVDVLAPSP